MRERELVMENEREKETERMSDGEREKAREI